MTRDWLFWIVTALAFGGVASSSATEPSSTATAKDWIITLGVEGRVQPSFEGGDRSVFRPIPLINIRRSGTPRGFSSPRDGASVSILDSGSFHLGPTAKLRFRRKESDDNNLRGLGDVKWVFEPGLFAEYWALNWLRLRAEVRQGIGGHHGVAADLSADLVAPASAQLTLSAGPRLVLASSKALAPYFAITTAQSAASGLPVYNVSGGVQSYGFGGQARYDWNSRWASHVFIEYDYLANIVASSPLVALRGNRNQVQIGIGTTYSFAVPGLW